MDDALRLAMIRLAKQYGCYGYRKVTALLHMEGWRVNHEKVECLRGEEGLQPLRQHKKHKRLYHKNSSIIRLRPTHPNHIWAIDFIHDKLSNGRSYKMLTVLDGIYPSGTLRGSATPDECARCFGGTAPTADKTW